METEADRPSIRAMKAAAIMEVHAAMSSQTIAKGRALDEFFPAYDELLDWAKRYALTVEYYIRADREAGDNEAAAMKTATLNMLRQTLAKAEPSPVAA